jgi:hypothetical protein
MARCVRGEVRASERRAHRDEVAVPGALAEPPATRGHEHGLLVLMALERAEGCGSWGRQHADSLSSPCLRVLGLAIATHCLAHV